MRKLLLLISAMAMILSSCSKEPTPAATIEFAGGQDDLSLNFSSQSATQTIVFSSNYNWTATPSDEWINVTPRSGQAGQECNIVVSLDANNTFDKRSGNIIINAQELNVVLAVSQEQNNAIILSTPTVNLPQSGGQFTVQLKANIDYEYEIKADWIKSVETRTLTDHSLRFEATENPSQEKRVGEIVIKGGGFSETVTVTQAQITHLTLSTTEQHFGYTGGKFSVEVQHNVDYDVKISDSWITRIESRAVETSTLNFAVAENTTCERRTATITISGGDVAETITVVQAQNNAIILSTPTVNLPQSGGQFTVQLKANIDYEYEIKADWIKSVETRALTDHSLRFEATENPSQEKRVGEIVIKGGGFSETVTVTQAQITHLTLSTTEQHFGYTGGEFSVEVQHNVDYDVKICDNWITQIESRAVETSTLNFAVAENTIYERRTATITISGGGISETITIVQSESTKIPNNVLIYTTTDGKCISPYYTTGFGAKCVSHTYVNGVGIITFDAPITSIRDYAFYRCSTIKSITLPNSVTSIGDYAFSDCTSLTSITIPDSVTEIGYRAFFGCTGELIINSKIVETNYSGYNYPSENGWLNGAEFTKLTIGNSITSIGVNAFQGCASLTSVTIGNSVTSIGGYAFYYCSSLTSVTIGNSVTSIGTSAFDNCSSLTSITIGNSVTSIGEYTFSGCTSLTSVYISDLSAWCKINFDNYRANPMYNGAKLYLNGVVLSEATIPSDVKEIKECAFEGCISLTSITIPDSVTSIGECAFYKCTSLTSVTIPDSVTEIGYQAFFGCTGELIINSKIVETNYTGYSYPIHGWLNGAEFTKLTIGNGVSSIGVSAFYDCTSLTSVTIGNSVTEIGDRSFRGCDSLKSITIPDSVTEIGDRSFGGCDSLKSVTIGNRVTSIGGHAFQGCASLTSVTIGNSVTEIGDSAFGDCTSLTSVTIGNSVTSIGEHAFQGCASLTSITIPDSVTSIGVSAFGDCTSLTSVTIPDSVTEIGNSAFFGCTGELIINSKIVETNYSDDNSPSHKWLYEAGFTKLTIGNSITSIGDYAFCGCTSLTSVNMPDSVTSIGDYAFCGCTSLTSVNMPDSVTSIGDRVLCGCTSLTSITIPDSVTSIGEYTFSGCTSLKSVTIGNSVTSIGGGAFENCSSLTSVNIPDSVTKIGDSAFENCASLTSITIPDSVTVIGYKTFDSCTSLKSITIPNSVTKIGVSAFYECASLTSVNIPDSVTKIEDSTFSRCASLTSVTIGHSVTSIGSYAFIACTSLKKVYCKPTTPPHVYSYAFSNNASERKIYVPYNSVDKYRAASEWKGYADDIVGYDF